jgi:hypothetical protein
MIITNKWIYEQKLENKVAVVTGGSAGIGLGSIPTPMH